MIPSKFHFFFIVLLVKIASSARHTFYDPHARYYIPSVEFWHAGLPVRLYADRFTSSSQLIARERVFSASVITPKVPVMSDPNGNYPLFDLLQYMSTYRTNHVVMLSFGNRTDIHESHWILRKYNKPWIWLHIPFIKGPHGTVPMITGEELNLEFVYNRARHVWICYDMTTAQKEPYGYMDEQLAELRKIAFNGYLKNLVGIVSLDIAHASNTATIPDELMKTKMRYIILEQRKGTDPKKINMKGVFRIIKAMGKDRVYLDVAPIIRNEVLKEFADDMTFTMNPDSDGTSGLTLKLIPSAVAMVTLMIIR